MDGAPIWAWWGSWWPWAEANQGLLSIVALGLAVGGLLYELRRANDERLAEAKKATENAAQAAEAAAAADARWREEMRQAEDRAVREAGWAADRARRASVDERLRRITEYCDAVAELVTVVADGFDGAAAAIEGQPFGELPPNLIDAARNAGESLEALLIAVPPDPVLISSTRKLVTQLKSSDRLGMVF